MKRLTVVQRNGRKHVILFDDADADLILAHSWHVTCAPNVENLFYARTDVRKPDGGWTGLRMHALLVGRGVDHRDGNGLNNQRANLRQATRSQNGGNQRRLPKGSSQYKGVSWRKDKEKWSAQVTVDGQRRFLGYFDDEKIAAQAYNQAALAAWGEFAFLNEVAT
jgi:hypothetical protein